MPTYISHKDQSEALAAGAKALLAQLRVVRESQIVLALPGGRSTAPFIEALSGLLSPTDPTDAAPWSRVQIFIVDERLVPLNHPDSNFGLVRKSCASLLEKNIISESQLHPFVSEDRSEEEAIRTYSDELRRFGGRFHITLISSGEDGHIAGLFPNHPGLRSTGLFTTFHDSPKPPPHRMTATRSLIEQSDAAFILFFGEGKRGALQNFKDGAVPLEVCPAKIVNAVATSVVVTDLV